MRIEIQRATARDWRRWKTIRLRALEEAPDAFGSTLEAERGFDDSVWRERLGKRSSACLLATHAREDASVELGLVACMPYEGKAAGSAGIFSMWVAPEARRAGVGLALMRAAIDWARSEGFERIYLDVGDANPAAIALYESLGFVATGRTGTLDPPREHILEHERVLELGD